MPVDGPSYIAGRTDERVLTMFCQVLTIDACGQFVAPKDFYYDKKSKYNSLYSNFTYLWLVG